VYAGKVSSTRQIAAGDININQATAHQFAGVLSVDYATASQVVAERSALPGGQFRNVSTLRFLPALKGKAITWLPNRLFVRTASESFRGFTRGAILFLLVFWLLHFFFCRMKVGPDQWLVPMVMLLAGLGLMMVSVREPVAGYRPLWDYRTSRPFLRSVSPASAA